jgi:hypothetical protein
MGSIDIIKAAKIAHSEHWQSTSDVGTGDRQAAAVTKAWQSSVASSHVKCEVPIMKNLGERIDVIDLSTATAYEMKVSSKNPQHEFYKDIFKVIIYNQHSDKKVKRLVFLTGKDGANKLRRGLGKAVMEFIAQYNLNIEVVTV